MWSWVEDTPGVSTSSTSGRRQRGDDRVTDFGRAALGVAAGGEVGDHCRVNSICGLREPEVVQHQRHREDGRRGVRQLLAGDVWCRTVYRLEHAGECAVRVDVSGGRQPDATAYCAGEVGEDVTEEVVCDDRIESRRICHQVDGRGVDV